MKKGWLLNLVMLALVASLVAFLYFRPKADVSAQAEHEVSQLKLADIQSVKVEFPVKAPVSFEKKDGLWRMAAPHKMRADQLLVQHIVSVIAATSNDRFSAADPAKYGLDKPQLKVKLKGDVVDAEFIYGTYNPVSDKQYVAYQDNVYLLSAKYSEAASTQPVELIDKRPLSPQEAKQVTGFNFSRLEQWEASRLNVDVDDGQWKVNIAKAKITQNEMNEWLDFTWKQSIAKSIELYTPDRQASYPSFEVKLKDGNTVHYDKLSEAPELLLARPDEGIIYHFSNDVGFTMLNPPLNLQ